MGHELDKMNHGIGLVSWNPASAKLSIFSSRGWRILSMVSVRPVSQARKTKTGKSGIDWIELIENSLYFKRLWQPLRVPCTGQSYYQCATFFIELGVSMAPSCRCNFSDRYLSLFLNHWLTYNLLYHWMAWYTARYPGVYPIFHPSVQSTPSLAIVLSTFISIDFKPIYSQNTPHQHNPFDKSTVASCQTSLSDRTIRSLWQQLP